MDGTLANESNLKAPTTLEQDGPCIAGLDPPTRYSLVFLAGLETLKEKLPEVAPFFQSHKSRTEAEGALASAINGTSRTMVSLRLCPVLFLVLVCSQHMHTHAGTA